MKKAASKKTSPKSSTKVTSNESGKKKVVYVIVGIFTVHFLSHLSNIAMGLIEFSDFGRLFFTILLTYFLYKGSNVARVLTVILLGLAGAMTTGFLFSASNPIFQLLLIVHSVYAFGSAYVLAGHKDVQAYFTKKK